MKIDWMRRSPVQSKGVVGSVATVRSAGVARSMATVTSAGVAGSAGTVGSAGVAGSIATVNSAAVAGSALTIMSFMVSGCLQRVLLRLHPMPGLYRMCAMHELRWLRGLLQLLGPAQRARLRNVHA